MTFTLALRCSPLARFAIATQHHDQYFLLTRSLDARLPSANAVLQVAYPQALTHPLEVKETK